MKTVISIQLLLLLTLCSTLTYIAQGKIAAKQIRSVRIDKKLPTAFLRVERIGKAKNSDIHKARLWFRLHNNTRWVIFVEASGEEKALGDARMYYDLLKDSTIEKSVRCHVCSIVKIAPGKSLLFSLPREELFTASSMRIRFSYEWEESDGFHGREPTHFVYFYLSDLEK